jgi:hypothetical protein
MKTRPHPRAKMKAEDVPAPSRVEFMGFVKALVSVPKPEIERREDQNQHRKQAAKK